MTDPKELASDIEKIKAQYIETRDTMSSEEWIQLPFKDPNRCFNLNPTMFVVIDFDEWDMIIEALRQLDNTTK